MKQMKHLLAILFLAAPLAQAQAPAGFSPLFNGRDLSGWKIPEGNKGNWKVVDGAIDCDGKIESRTGRDLLTERQFQDFVLRLDWRITGTPYINPRARIILPDGSYKLGLDGQPVSIALPDTDSGVLLRGGPQINMWCWPVGSGEIWNTRLHKESTAEMRAAATPMVHADRNIGEWNTFEITLKGNRASVVLNGKLVIRDAVVLGLPARGPIGLQHHGVWTGKWTSPPTLMQFRNIYIKEL